MPLIKIEKTNNYTYGLWEIKETEEVLLKQLRPNTQELIAIRKINHLKRKKQNIAARLILNKLANRKIEIFYSKNGQPRCKHFNHLSISHSHDYCIVIVNNHPVGIDIQYKKSNIKELSKKFINDIEGASNMNSVLELHLVWCAKEAIYKTINDEFFSFKENIYIEPIKNNMQTIGYYKNNAKIIKYQISYKRIKNYFIAIANKNYD